MKARIRIYVEGEPLSYINAAQKIGVKVPSLRYAVNKCPAGWRYKGFWISKFPKSESKAKANPIEEKKTPLSEVDEFLAFLRETRARILDSLHGVDALTEEAFAKLKERDRQKGGHVFTGQFSTHGERVG